MLTHDARGEIYRGWLIVLIPYEEYYFYEIHSPEGYINRNLKPFDSPEVAIACGRRDVDGVIQLFEQVDAEFHFC